LTLDPPTVSPKLLTQITGRYGAPFVASLPEHGPDGDHAAAFEDLRGRLSGAGVVLFPRVSPGDLDRFFYLRLLQVLRREPPLLSLSVVVLTTEPTGPRLAGGFAARFKSGWPFAQCVFLTEHGDPAALSASLGLPVSELTVSGLPVSGLPVSGLPVSGLTVSAPAGDAPSVVCPEIGASQKIALQVQRVWGRCGSTTGFENQLESLVAADYLTIRLFSDAVRRRGATLTARMGDIIAENSVNAGPHINVLAVPEGPPVPIRTRDAEIAWATWLATTATCTIRDPLVAEAARRADAVIANHLECVGPALVLAPQARLLLEIRDDRARATSEMMRRDGRSEADVRAAEAVAAGVQARVLAIPDICGHVSVAELERLGPQSQRSAILLPRAYQRSTPEPGTARAAESEAATFDVLVFGDEHPFNITSVRWFVDAVWRPYLAPEAVSVAIAGRVGRHVQDSGSGPVKQQPHEPPRRPREQTGEQTGGTSALRILGFVDDLDALRATCRLTAVPDRQGTGTAVKTLATLAAGHPLVTTPVGVRGLDPLVSDMLPAHDDAAAFAADILTLLRDPERLAERRRAVGAAQNAIRRGPDHAALLASVPRPTPRLRAERQARWARVVAAAIASDPRPFCFSPGTSFAMNGSVADGDVLLGGWHGPEAWGRWTDGDTASLRITLPAPAAEPLALELELMPSEAGGTVSVSIDGVGLATAEVVSGWVMWPIPGAVTEGKTSFLVTLRSSATICPSRSGGSTDDRILGVGVKAVRLHGRGTAGYETGKYLSTRSAAANGILLSGWHEMEDWGCWSSGRTAALELILAAPPKGRVLLELDIAPSPVRSMLTLEVNGHALAAIVPVNGGNQWLLPVDATRERSRLWITLTVSETVRPADIDASADGRTLGVGLRGLAAIDLGSS
jgi:hypothetical protein